jgi:hypothetical protein
MMMWANWQEELITILDEFEQSFDEIERGLTKVEKGLETSEAASREAGLRLDDLDSSWRAYQTATNQKLEQLEQKNTFLIYVLGGTIVVTVIGLIISFLT